MSILSAYTNALNLNKTAGEASLPSSGGASLGTSSGGLSFKDHLGSSGTASGTSSVLGGIGSHVTGAISSLRGAESLTLQAAKGQGHIDPVQVDTAAVQAALELEQGTKVISTLVATWNDISKTGF